MDDKQQDELVQLARLAIAGKPADIRMYISRLSRRYRNSQPTMSQAFADLLSAPTVARPGRLSNGHPASSGAEDEGRPSVLRLVGGEEIIRKPVFADALDLELRQLLLERSRADLLQRHGLRAASSAIFVGPPGVGKTATARWMAEELQLPLLTLDLTTVMSSRLGQSGANLREALDHARAVPSVLFLDEIDAIAKRRDDSGDVGELKRLVTILLQELDTWPSTSLLLAATNHADLVDPALWRRFDMRLDFTPPAGAQLTQAIELFLSGDDELSKFTDVLATVFEGASYADIKQSLLAMRKLRVLGVADATEIIGGAVKDRLAPLARSERISLATRLVETGGMSQRRAASLIGVSRDTIREHTGESQGEES